MAQKPIAKKSIADDPRFTQAIQNYETGLRAMQEHKFDKAKTHLQKVIGGPSKELADRANVHLNTCNQHLDKRRNQFKSAGRTLRLCRLADERGRLRHAREHLESFTSRLPRPTTSSTELQPSTA